MADDHFLLKLVGSILLGILTPVLFLFALYMGSSKEREYVKNGVLTECVVENVVKISNRQQVTVIYQNESGKKIKAKGTLNREVDKGDVVQAYVLADKPGEVYYPADGFIKAVCYILVGIFSLLAWVPLVMLIHKKRMNDLNEKLRAMNNRYN